LRVVGTDGVVVVGGGGSSSSGAAEEAVSVEEVVDAADVAESTDGERVCVSDATCAILRLREEERVEAAAAVAAADMVMTDENMKERL
jgi:hypothetical protein